jgi:uncharacterized membrane protein
MKIMVTLDVMSCALVSASFRRLLGPEEVLLVPMYQITGRHVPGSPLILNTYVFG